MKTDSPVFCPIPFYRVEINAIVRTNDVTPVKKRVGKYIAFEISSGAFAGAAISSKQHLLYWPF
jgi:hypothetical protein